MSGVGVGDYSRHDPEMLDAESRGAMAAKILGILQAHLGSSGSSCLDIGCSAGHITERLALRFRLCVGVDVDRAALQAAAQRAPTDSPHPHYALASGTELPFPAETFDVVCCNQVYQYVPEPEALMAEIRRVLRPGGVCFFSARNLWGLAYRDNWRPFFLRYAPALAGLAPAKANWRERSGQLRSYPELVRLAEGFRQHDYTWQVMLHPQRYGFAGLVRWAPALRRLPQWVRRALLPVIPNHLWVLEKEA
ncbi:MAG: methyltransferase domain-containing protein [Anaerolineae bacterium]